MRTIALALAACSLSLTLSTGAHAAQLRQVGDWDNTNMPNDVSMYSYVPDQVSDNPPVVVLIHYCGGTATNVFGQAQGGGLVQAADTYGFIMVVPSSARCWDIVSDKTRTRDGFGDSHAIKTMANYAIEKLGGNADRVYATGDSSGGMMTELLLGLYPDLFKGGSAMAGMPAGCRGDNENGNGGGYSNACAGGNVDRTPEEWGQVVESLSPGYDGLRPRVQLFHGDADTIIGFKNHTEAIDEWTYVHGLDLTPDTEDDQLMVGDHPGLRQTWLADCGLPVVDAFTSYGGDHGPSDALFLADYIVPFLGLDDTGAEDPHVAACSASTGTGGASGAGTGGAEGMGTGGRPGMGSGGASAPLDPGSGGALPAGSGGTVSDPTGTGGGMATAAGGQAPDPGTGVDSSGASGNAGDATRGCTWAPAGRNGGLWFVLGIGAAFLGLAVRRRRLPS